LNWPAKTDKYRRALGILINFNLVFGDGEIVDFDRQRRAINGCAELSKSGEHQQALRFFDDSIVEAI
jgi:hypothetical protein